MKKLFILLVFLGFALIANSQTLVKSDQVISYTYADSLEKNDVVTLNYYVKDFLINARVTVVTDSIISGYTKTRTITYGSIDYSNWVNLDTISTAGLNGGTATNLRTSVYYPYYRVKTTAIDSTQSTRLKVYILFDKN
jgi:hypothetical protein